MAETNRSTALKSGSSEYVDIDGFVKDFDEDNAEWIDRMDSDYEIYTLKAYSLDKESSNVTSPEPRRYADKVIQTAEAAKMLVKVTTPETAPAKSKQGFDLSSDNEDESTKNKDKETAIERLLYGLFSIADKQLRRDKVIYGRTVVSADIFHAAIRGSIVRRIILQKQNKEIYPDILPIDPRYFKYALDNKGLAKCAIETWRDPEAIKAEYDIDVDDVTYCVDYWDREKNIIQVGDQQFHQAHGLGKPPFVFRPVGSSPIIYTTDSKFENISCFGESIFAASRNLYGVKNKILTIWLSLLEKSHKPSYFVFSPGGKAGLEELPWGTNKMLYLPDTARAEMVKPPDIAMTAPQLYKIIDQEIQANDLSTIEYGLIAGSEYPSGKSMLALQEGKDSKITPILKALAAVAEDTAEMLIEQYEKTGVKTTFRGYDSKGKLFYQEIKPTDVKKPWDVDIEFVSITPEQETQNIAKAQMLLSMGLPDEYVYENALQMQDPQKPIRQKYLQKLAETDPIIAKKLQHEAALKEGHTDEAQKTEMDLMQMLKQYMEEKQKSQQPVLETDNLQSGQEQLGQFTEQMPQIPENNQGVQV